MPRVQSPCLPRARMPLTAAALVLLIATSLHAQTTLENRDYDLVADNGLFHYSMVDGHWSAFYAGPAQVKTIGDCGCLLSVLATVINHEVTGISPWYPTQLFDGSPASDFNPRYIDTFLNFGVDGTWQPGWGYKKGLPPDTCGVIPLTMGLQAIGNFAGHPVGINAVYVRGSGPNVQKIINRNLNAGRPTIIAFRTGTSAKANHAMLIAGWDHDFNAYRVLDPADQRAGINGVHLPQVEFAHAPGTNTGPVDYPNFWARVTGIIDIRPGTTAIRPGILFGDDPSPVEILMTGPDGRRTGFDARTGADFEENDQASYWTLGPWADPLNEADESGGGPRFITFHDAPAGTYHFEVTGTAAGALQLSAETIFGGTRVVVGEFGGTIAAGEVRKYEFQFGRTGPSSVAQVSNFTPHAFAGEDLHARTDAAITFDGGRSFDADGALASFAWDFGDGSTGVGPKPQHVYTTPGDYTVVLTVTDAAGATATDSLLANVILSQRRPVADASGPYLGFASADSQWYVLLDARGSSDPNGDALTYRWDFGDGSPVRTTSVGYVDHTYAAVGAYTMTVVVNDGIEDSMPASARVDIVQAPNTPMFGSTEASLTPECGPPGTSVTITAGEFAQFQWWNFGAMGPLPQFPPKHLMLGLSAPDGTMRLGLPGGESAYVPFQATQLGPGRYVARATFTVADLAPGMYGVIWAEEEALPFQVPCPVPANHPPEADAGGPYAASVGSAIAFDGSASSDADGDGLTYEWDFGDLTVGEGTTPTHTYAKEGRYIVTLSVSDGHTRSAATPGSRSFARAIVTATAGDSTPPTISGMPGDACTLWPPNHKLVTVANITASDAGSGLAANGLVVSVTSSEAADAGGDGHTAPDFAISGGSVALRAERSGTGAGRTYTITATATDQAGNVTRLVSSCVVPHDRGVRR